MSQRWVFLKEVPQFLRLYPIAACAAAACSKGKGGGMVTLVTHWYGEWILSLNINPRTELFTNSPFRP
jgi:hypothetical protein